LAASKNHLKGERLLGEWAQFGDRFARTGDGKSFASDGAVDDVAAAVAEFSDGYFGHGGECITRDTRDLQECLATKAVMACTALSASSMTPT